MKLYTKTRRNPKHNPMSAAEEAEYERYEAALARARIMELGVAAMLDKTHGEYLSTIESAEASRVLADAVAIRAGAQTGRAAIRAAAEKRDAAAPKRKVKAA